MATLESEIDTPEFRRAKAALSVDPSGSLLCGCCNARWGWLPKNGFCQPRGQGDGRYGTQAVNTDAPGTAAAGRVPQGRDLTVLPCQW